MKNITLNKMEMEKLCALQSALATSPDALDQELTKQFGDNAAAVRAELENGVDDFYRLFSKDVDESTVREALVSHMKDMDLQQKYAYLTNIMLSMTVVCGQLIEGGHWETDTEVFSSIQSEIEKGNVPEPQVIETQIGEMMDLIAKQTMASSVLLIAEPPYEDLMEACKVEKPEKIRAIAHNTREFAVNSSAALYIMQERGDLTSLGQARLSARDMGVVTASALEIDAAKMSAHKDGLWEKAKALIEKATRVAVTLLISSPAILLEFTSILVLMAFFGLTTKLWGIIGLMVLLINAVKHVKAVDNVLKPQLDELTTDLDHGLDIVVKAASKLTNAIVQSARRVIGPVWARFRDFVNKHIVFPVASRMKPVTDKVKDYVADAKAVANDLQPKVNVAPAHTPGAMTHQHGYTAHTQTVKVSN